LATKFVTWQGMKTSFLRQLRCKNTQIAYGIALKQFKEYLRINHRSLDPIIMETSDDYIALRKAIEDWIWEQSLELKESSVQNKLTAVKSFYDYLINYMIIDRNPAYMVQVTNLNTPAPLKIPESEDVDALIANILYLSKGVDDLPARRDSLIIRFLREGGFRVTELRNLQLSDCQTNGHVKIRVGKGNKSRITAVQIKTIEDVFTFAAHFDLTGDDYLFMSTVYYRPPWTAKMRKRQRGGAGPLTSRGLNIMLKRRSIEAGFSDSYIKMLCRPHAYRHLWAVEHIKAETNHIFLMRMAGWTSSAMINYYLGETALDVHAVER